MSTWINHIGKRCPVNSGVLVDVRYRYSGAVRREQASNVNWSTVTEYSLVAGDAMHDELPAAEPSTVFVYGPQGCGKTRNAERLREFFGCYDIVDEYVNDGRTLEEGSLHLCVKAPVFIAGTGYRVLPFDYAMQLLAEGDTKLTTELPSAELCSNCGRAGGKHEHWCARGGVKQAESTALDRQEGGNHYKDMPIQPVQFIHANALGYFEGNVIKYVARWRKKNGVADLEKARHYIDLLIELEAKKVVDRT